MRSSVDLPLPLRPTRPTRASGKARSSRSKTTSPLGQVKESEEQTRAGTGHSRTQRRDCPRGGTGLGRQSDTGGLPAGSRTPTTLGRGNRRGKGDNPAMRFSTTIVQTGNNTGIEVPPEALDALGGGKRPAVTVTVADYVYRSTVATMGGRSLIPLSAEHRRASGLAG